MLMTDFQGSLTALATPFRDGRIDEAAFSALIERQINAGTHGLVPAGTTGEAPTISDAEYESVIGICVETAAGRAPVLAGAGSNNTEHAIALARRAAALGADAILAVTGYYNRPSQAGLIAHFTALHDAISAPIFIYNIPPRTVAGLSLESLAALSKLERIIGVKDATGDLSRAPLQRKMCGPEFVQMSGDDMTAVGFNAMGGKGCISVTANVAPELCAQMQNHCLEGDYTRALEIQDKLANLHRALFTDASPGPVKYALSLMNLCTDELRLPLSPPCENSKMAVKGALKELGLIS